MNICRDCAGKLEEDYNLCPYCGTPTDRFIREIEELPEGVELTEEQVLVFLAACGEQIAKTMQNPEQQTQNIRDSADLAKGLPNVDGGEFGGAQLGPLERQQREYDTQKQSEDLTMKEELKGFITRRTVLVSLMAMVVVACMVVVVFFSSVMEPDLQMELGDDYMAAQQYEKAEKSYANVLKQDKTSTEALEKLIEVKRELNVEYENNREIIALIDRLQKLTIDPDIVRELDYQKVSLYIQLGDKSGAQTIMQRYVPLPEFVMPSGSYSAGTMFEIKTEKGKIEYTIDKEKTPVVYTGAIMLEPGEHTIRAYVIDENGLKGEKAEVYYLIEQKQDID